MAKLKQSRGINKNFKEMEEVNYRELFKQWLKTKGAYDNYTANIKNHSNSWSSVTAFFNVMDKGLERSWDSAIISAFKWNDTKEGMYYWREIESQWLEVYRNGHFDGYEECQDLVSFNNDNFPTNDFSCARNYGEFKGKGIYLVDNYDWELVKDSRDTNVLIAKYK